MDARGAWDAFRKTGNIDAYMMYKRLILQEIASETSVDVKKDADADKHGRDRHQGNEYR